MRYALPSFCNSFTINTLMAHVSLRNVSKSYDGLNTVLHGIDVDVADGEFVVLVGPSGCGKSTLLRMLAGLESVTGGDITIGETRVNDLPPRSRDIAMVFQDYALYPHKTLFENMAFGLRLRKMPEAEIAQRVNDAAKLLKIEHLLGRKPAALSGGQRQRVAIGRAIVRQPQVFLFDEPLSNLDAQMRDEMRSEIKKLHHRLGATIVYVTHDQVEAMTLADRIAIMQGGRVVQFDTPEVIYKHPANLFVAGFIGSPPMNLLPAHLQGESLVLAQQSLVISSEQAKRCAAASAITVGIRPENLHLQAQSATDAVLQTRVALLEPLGAETLVTFALGDVELVARLPAEFKAPIDALVNLYVSHQHLHFFDAHSTLAL